MLFLQVISLLYWVVFCYLDNTERLTHAREEIEVQKKESTSLTVQMADVTDKLNQKTILHDEVVLRYDKLINYLST